MRLGLKYLKAKAEPEYVMTLIDCYTEEHSKDLELRTAPTHSGSHFIFRKRPFQPPLSTHSLPVNIFLNKKCNGNYDYLTLERTGKLARGIAKLLFDDATLCRCSDYNECSCYSEVMSEAGARISFEQLHHKYQADFLPCPVLENGENKVTKRSPRRWWNPFSWQWPNKIAVQSKQCDRKNKNPTTIPKRMQVKYLKKH